MADSMEEVGKRMENFPLLPPGELHVWHVSTRINSKKLKEYKSVLTEKDLTKASFFKFDQGRDSYVISQGALQMLLSGYLGISPNLVKLGRREKGKPYSIDDPGLFFNMSNSGELVAIAFSRDSDVGIDIEKIREIHDLEDMIAKNFTSREIKFITAKPEEKINRFFRFWTIKESYLKAIGEGMRLPPDHLEFAIENDRIRQLSVKGIFDQEDWNFEEFSTSDGYVGTITFGRANTVIKQMEF